MKLVSGLFGSSTVFTMLESNSISTAGEGKSECIQEPFGHDTCMVELGFVECVAAVRYGRMDATK